MAWRDQLRTASFRGVPFQVDHGSLAAGRRLARHEYPQRDIPYLEDMGRRAREYRVEAFVIGPDYMAARDELLAAIEEEGAGQLVHPWHGTLNVTVADCQLTESTRHGGLASFALVFIEAGQQIEPDAETDTEGALDAQADQCDADFAADFAQDFSIDGLPEFAVQDALGVVQGLLALPAMALGEVSRIMAYPRSALNALLPQNLLASLGNPLALAEGLLSLVRQAGSVLDLFDAADGVAVAPAVYSTPVRQAVIDNRNALAGLVRQAATARRIGDLARTPPATLDDARLARAEIVRRADAVLLDETTGARAAEAIVQLRTDAVAHFIRIQPELPRLVRLTPQAVLPALVLAHDFYGDAWLAAGREDELIARNRVRHPGFVPAGRPLEMVA